MKKKFAFLLAVIMTLAVFVPVNAMTNDIKIQLNGDTLSTDVSPIIENGRTLVPMRTVFEKMGADVQWDAVNKVVKIEDQYTVIEISIDKDTALIYRKYDLTGTPEKVKLDTPAKIIKGRTFVPVRFVVETLNSSIKWDGDHRTVVIVTPDHTPKPVVRLDKEIKFEVVDTNVISNKELETWFNINSDEEGFCYKTINGVSYIKATGGMKPSGGYAINVNGLYDLGNGKLYLEALLSEPDPDDIVTMALTYPKALIKVSANVAIKEVTGLVIKSKPPIIIDPVEINLPFEEVNLQTVKNAALVKWVDTYKHTSGIHYMKQENTIYVLLAAGSQPTGGYSIEVDSVTQVNPDSAYVNAKLVPPDPNLMTLQVITYPFMVVKFDGTTIKDVQGTMIGTRPTPNLR